MRYWIREVAGWFFVGLGLFAFYLCYVMLLNHDIFEAWPLVFIGFILFRGGIQLLKVATAARLWSRAQEALEPTRVVEARRSLYSAPQKGTQPRS